MASKSIGGIVLVLCIPALMAGAATHAREADDVRDEVLLVVERDAVLAFSGPAGRWVSERLGLNELVLDYATDGNVAVAITTERVLGFSAQTGKWDQVKFSKGEKSTDLQVQGNVATVKTERRALGFSAHTGTWVARRFGFQ
jgi:hypothetical protein